MISGNYHHEPSSVLHYRVKQGVYSEKEGGHRCMVLIWCIICHYPPVSSCCSLWAPWLPLMMAVFPLDDFFCAGSTGLCNLSINHKTTQQSCYLSKQLICIPLLPTHINLWLISSGCHSTRWTEGSKLICLFFFTFVSQAEHPNPERSPRRSNAGIDIDSR